MASGLGKGDLMNSVMGKQPSTNLVSNSNLWGRLKRGAETRARFVKSHLSKNLAFQIRAMHDREGWSQEALAEKVGMNQNAISRRENSDYGKPTLTTLKRLAAAFDVALAVRFVPFGELVDWVSGTPRVDMGLSGDSLNPASFADELESLEQTKNAVSLENYSRTASNVGTQLKLDLMPGNVARIDQKVAKKTHLGVIRANVGELASIPSAEPKMQSFGR